MDNSTLAAELQQSAAWLREHLNSFPDSRDRNRALSLVEQAGRACAALTAAAKGAKK